MSGLRRGVLSVLLVSWLGAGLLAVLAQPRFEDAPRRAREVALRTNLRTFCDAIEQYHQDKGSYPAGLGTLVEDGYLRFVPVDPITRRDDTWILDRTPVDGGVVAVLSGADGHRSRELPCQGRHDA